MNAIDPAQTGATPSSAADPVLVALDDGYAQVKALYIDENNAIQDVVIPTFVRPDNDGMLVMDLGGEDARDINGWYETEGQRFLCGRDVAGEEVRFSQYHTSPWNRVSVHHALQNLGLGGRTVELKVGLPIGDYFIGGKPNVELIDRKVANLMVPVRRLDTGTESVTVAAASVLPQGLAAWMDFAFDTEGNYTAEFQSMQGPVAVIDIGGRTVDVAVITSRMAIDFRRTATDNVGVLDAREELGKLLCARFGYREIAAPVLEVALRSRVARIAGQRHDVSEQVEAALHTVSQRLRVSVDRILRDVSDIEAVLLVGGGASLFSNIVSIYPQALMSPNPEMANARGMLKRHVLARRPKN